MGWRRERRRAATTQRALDSLAVAVRGAEAARIVATKIVDSAVQSEVKARDKLIDTYFESYITADSAKAAIRDTTATTEQLRVQLQAMVASSERLRQDAMAYQRTIDTLLLGHLTEREAWLAERAALTAYQERTADALSETTCRVGLVPCPSRWHAFGAGVLVALTFVLVLG